MSRIRAEPTDARARVLVVDDHPLVREGLSAQISAQPDLVVCGEAGGVEEALALAHSARPSVILLDLALKGGNGLTLVRKLRESGGMPKILVVSAY